MVNFVRRGTMLDDAPWTWGSTGGWSQGMPSFFGDVATATQGSDYPLMYNVWDDLDTTPTTWTYMAEPVDPCEYQEGWLGQVINIY